MSITNSYEGVRHVSWTTWAADLYRGARLRQDFVEAWIDAQTIGSSSRCRSAKITTGYGSTFRTASLEHEGPAAPRGTRRAGLCDQDGIS